MLTYYDSFFFCVKKNVFFCVKKIKNQSSPLGQIETKIKLTSRGGIFVNNNANMKLILPQQKKSNIKNPPRGTAFYTVHF